MVAALWAEGELGRWDCGGGWHDIVHRDGSGSLVNGQRMEEDFWGVEAEPPFGFFIRLKVRVASFVDVRHGVASLAMKGAVGFTAEIGVFQRMGTGLSAVGRGAGNEDGVVAFADETLVEEGSK